MRLYIMRHGQAHALAETDMQRELTSVGRVEASTVGIWMRSKGVRPDSVWVSPYQRAQQSAALVMEESGDTAGNVHTRDGLTPCSDVDALVWHLQAEALQNPDSCLLVVSHMPLVGLLVEALVPAVCAPIFPTAGLACMAVQGESQSAHFSWLRSPTELGTRVQLDQNRQSISSA